MIEDVPIAIQGLCTDFLEGLKAALREKLVVVTLYGSWAFPDGSATAWLRQAGWGRAFATGFVSLIAIRIVNA
jgi:hypothetical protein